MKTRNKPPFPGARRTTREHRINEEITAETVRLVGEKGAEVVPLSEALRRAREAGVDLVEIAQAPDMPVVKIIDYGKFKFEKTKKDKESRKKQKIIQVKEIKMGPKIDTGDFDRKVQLAQEFLNEGDNVKVTMRFKGREIAHTELGLEKLMEFKDRLEQVAIVEKMPSMEGRMMSMVLRPRGKNNPPKKSTPSSSVEPPQGSESTS
ncbi:MAG: translation initiation factor IF-3 [Leptospiraceae bacterium]|nr:translation initiation factor IF-3 [Leptospiraceae bacterium]MDW8306425.1 translation initiation factor IF-3 [Leptospiraceae bacterium]